MSALAETQAPYLAATILTIPFVFYLSWRTFVPKGQDAPSAKRWVLWIKIAVPLFLIGALFEMILYCVQLAGIYSMESGVAFQVGYLFQNHSVIALFLSLAEAAHWLAALRNNGLPVRNSGWSRILAYVVAVILSGLNFTVFGMQVDSYVGTGARNYYGFLYAGVISFTIQVALTALGITLVGLSIALRVKTRGNVELVSASKHLLAASVLFLVPLLWYIVVVIVQAVTLRTRLNGRGPETRWLFVVSAFLYWLPLTACLFTQNLLRARRVGAEDASKERSQSV